MSAADLDNVTASAEASNMTSSDHFPALMENNFAKIIGLGITIANVLLAPLMLYFIIWYERFENTMKRTLINMLTSMICWTLIIFLGLILQKLILP